MTRIQNAEELDAALDRGRAVFYKHSPVCALSLRARRHVIKFRESFPDSTVYLVDVIADRAVSQRLEQRLGVRHESPQVILVEGGRAVAHASHRDVRSDTLADWWSGDDAID